jgi:basic amino acid/polyamine antiporter, APA family
MEKGEGRRETLGWQLHCHPAEHAIIVHIVSANDKGSTMNDQPRTANEAPPSALPHPPSPFSPPSAAPRRQLTLFDSTCIIVGIIIGAGIFRSTPDVARLAPNATWLMGLWFLGGVFSLVGALCYAELGTAYPQEGGDYVYLTRAFGRSVGFLFAWCQLWIVRPGSIGVMAYAFAEYANRIWPQAKGGSGAYVLVLYAAGAIVALTAVNMLGVPQGKWTQNVLTTAKVLGLAAIVGVGLLWAAPAAATPAPAAPSPELSLADLGLAMVFVLFTYGGWNEMAFVGAEVREPRKNILRALLLGTLAVTAIYLLVNVALLHALGLAGSRHATPAAEVLELAVGRWAAVAISGLICISALGAINGQIFTGARIYYAMGSEHRLYAWLGRWNARRGTPVCSLVIQGAITLALAVWFGLGREGFESMVKFTTPGFWLFLMLVGVSVLVLRKREPSVDRPYRVPGYPLTPIAFSLCCGLMVYSSLSYAMQHGSWEALWSIAILLLGVAMSFYRPDSRCQS